MPATSPIAIVLLGSIIALVVGGIIVWWHSRRIFSGYGEIASDARQIQALLHGELFRDGDDLVVSGNLNHLPTLVRFSYSEYSPGVNATMKAHSTFSLSVVPKGEKTSEGRVLVRSSEEMFDARFTSRSDHPTQAKMFLGGKAAMAALQKLMCSNKTFFTVTTGQIELSELVIPANAGRHMVEHLRQMGQVAETLKAMPGAETIKIAALKREGRTLARAAIAVGVVGVILAIVAAMRPTAQTVTEAGETPPPAGILPVDAVLMQRLEGCHLVEERDLRPAADAWLRDHNLQLQGRIAGDYSGAGNGRDVAYVLVTPSGQRRLVLLANGVSKYDSTFPQIDLVARLPQRAFRSVQWVGNAPKAPDGDALLVVRDLNDPNSAVVLYLTNQELASAVPVNFQSISLE